MFPKRPPAFAFMHGSSVPVIWACRWVVPSPRPCTPPNREVRRARCSWRHAHARAVERGVYAARQLLSRRPGCDTGPGARERRVCEGLPGILGRGYGDCGPGTEGNSGCTQLFDLVSDTCQQGNVQDCVKLGSVHHRARVPGAPRHRASSCDRLKVVLGGLQRWGCASLLRLAQLLVKPALVTVPTRTSRAVLLAVHAAWGNSRPVHLWSPTRCTEPTFWRWPASAEAWTLARSSWRSPHPGIGQSIQLCARCETTRRYWLRGQDRAIPALGSQRTANEGPSTLLHRSHTRSGSAACRTLTGGATVRATGFRKR